MAWLASHTERIEFGPLVTPVSFRHPVFTARIAAQLDDLAGGRLILGVGAGWQEREHTAFGFDLLPLAERMDRFEEGLEVDEPPAAQRRAGQLQRPLLSLHEAVLLPRPQRPGGPPLLIGGNGPQRTLPLVVALRRRVERGLTPARSAACPLRRAQRPAGQPAGRAGPAGQRRAPLADDRPGLRP